MLMRDVVTFGGKIVIRKFNSPQDLISLTESVIVNCTGLGSRTIFSDEELVPVRGQLTVCIPQPEVNYRASGRLPNSTVTASINPRSDGLVVGNMQERGTWSLEPNQEVRQQNVDAAIQFFSAMRAPSNRIRLTKSGPPRVTPNLKSFYGLES
jgi:glycine/D-amino acid oxidase-like deaminating enzyme